MKALLISSLYHPNIVGGAERVVQTLAEALVRRDCRVTVACLSRDRWPRTIEHNGVRVYYLPLRNLYWPFGKGSPNAPRKALWHALDTYNSAMAREVGRVLEAERPDVVNTHNITGFSTAVWREVKRHSLPTVHTLHDQYLLCPRSTMFKNGRNCSRPCLECRVYSAPRKRMTRLVDAVVGVSRFILDRHLVLGLFPNAKRAVIHNSYERPPDIPPRGPRHANRPLHIGFLGGLHPSKGVNQLIDAFLQLPAGAAELRIAGRGDAAYEKSLKAQTQSRADVRWLGFVKTESVLPDLDIVVVPSRCNDTAPRVLMEALAFGIPVIGSNRGGIPELISGGSGWVFDSDDAKSLPSLLRRALDEPLLVEEMGQRALHAAQQFTEEVQVPAYLRVFQAVRESSV